jgi:hypothetical protein
MHICSAGVLRTKEHSNSRITGSSGNCVDTEGVTFSIELGSKIVRTTVYSGCILECSRGKAGELVSFLSTGAVCAAGVAQYAPGSA